VCLFALTLRNRFESSGFTRLSLYVADHAAFLPARTFAFLFLPKPNGWARWHVTSTLHENRHLVLLGDSILGRRDGLQARLRALTDCPDRQPASSWPSRDPGVPGTA
jgi:hypothetical protein